MPFSFPSRGALCVLLAVLAVTASPVSCGQDHSGGLGLSVAQLYDPRASGNRGPLVVLYALPGGPAHQQGITGGDIIIRVDGRPTTGRDFNELVNDAMRGPVGSKAELWIKRASTREELFFTLTRIGLEGV
ncbi:MAG: PDZ domain-containing protein [Deltaproteobacteria bacterium]|nr:PDZ domain-containing protein [Deltaproteobacteria bacterium]